MTYTEALIKAEKYCAYQERSQQEVRRRLRAWRVEEEAAEAVIAELIAQQFLNESRYARAFVSGHYRIKRWGRLKITQALRADGLSERCIQDALSSADFSDYAETIRKAADAWERTHAYCPPEERKWKLRDYLFRRGFEPDAIDESLIL